MKVIRKNWGIVHRIADCTECDWREEGYKDAHKLIIKHVKETGHTAHIENGNMVEYKVDGRISKK